jgi:3',5'-cyclic-AMP phosphodiesterase
MKILWITDTHLDCLFYENAAYEFGTYLRKEHKGYEALFLTGDISDGDNTVSHLRQLSEGWNKPIYFVLGNHDYYNSSFEDMDEKIKTLCDNDENLNWMSDKHFMIGDVAVVGSGGWYDAMFGNARSNIILYDFTQISNLLQSRSTTDLFLQTIKDRSKYHAAQLKSQLKEVSDKESILVLTHIPPYHQCAWHNGAASDADFLPWFTSYYFGNVLDEFCDAHPDTKVNVFCGHSHSPGTYKIGNLKVFTGKAMYGFPDTCGSIFLDEGIINAYDEKCEMKVFKI